jgi:hypothetical protein
MEELYFGVYIDDLAAVVLELSWRRGAGMFKTGQSGGSMLRESGAPKKYQKGPR